MFTKSLPFNDKLRVKASPMRMNDPMRPKRVYRKRAKMEAPGAVTLLPINSLIRVHSPRSNMTPAVPVRYNSRNYAVCSGNTGSPRQAATRFVTRAPNQGFVSHTAPRQDNWDRSILLQGILLIDYSQVTICCTCLAVKCLYCIFAFPEIYIISISISII